MELNLKQVKSLFSSQDYARGMEYFRQGRVLDMACTGEAGQAKVTCSVRGSQIYSVRFQELQDGYSLSRDRN